MAIPKQPMVVDADLEKILWSQHQIGRRGTCSIGKVIEMYLLCKNGARENFTVLGNGIRRDCYGKRCPIFLKYIHLVITKLVGVVIQSVILLKMIAVLFMCWHYQTEGKVITY